MSKQRSRTKNKSMIIPKITIMNEPILKVTSQLQPKVEFLDDIKGYLNYEQNKNLILKYLNDHVKNKFNTQLNILLHQGQRKLFLTELYFLAMYAELSKHVLYIGAAPGEHISILSFLFPSHTFYCYDLTPFKIKSTPKIKLFKQFFTEKDIPQYINKNVLFIADIRSRPISTESILNDMNKQSEWIKQLNPIKSIIKFRAPYAYSNYCLEQVNTVLTNSSKDCIYKYLNGDLLIQPWSRIISSELRLIISRPITEKEYNCNEIDNKMLYLNMIIRKKLINTKNGKNITWDQQQENAIIQLFKNKYPIYKKINITSILDKLKIKNEKY